MGCISMKSTYREKNTRSIVNESRGAQRRRPKRIKRINILIQILRHKSSLQTIPEVRPEFEYSSSKEIVE